MPENVLFFDEYSYTDSGGVRHQLFYTPSTEKWTVSGLHFTLSEIGIMFKIPKDELIVMKLKYGG